MTNAKRIRTIREGAIKKGPVALWMSRDQRVDDNWALLHAQERAIENRVPLCTVFVLVPRFLGATSRQYQFMLDGLREVESRLSEKNIPFFLECGPPAAVLPRFIRKWGISALVKDFDPLRIKAEWTNALAQEVDIPIYEVDAHNVIPCWVASRKQEFSARTFRPKIQRLLPEFLDEFPKLKKHPLRWPSRPPTIDWEKCTRFLDAEHVPEVTWIKPGERAARRRLFDFIEQRLLHYPVRRNDPSTDGQSGLSPYLHFGHISAQRIALEIAKADAGKQPREAFLEELIVRRELADNYCFYNAHYDTFQGFPEWAKKTLDAHRNDRRPYIYAKEQLESGHTHDPLWNAAQLEMVKRGKMHGYMRMYWAKKILEWTPSPEQAQEIAIALNDRYEIDGRDPNGYAGIAWSIGGVHDRAWAERPVFGKIRYMSYEGCRSKFNIEEYIAHVQAL